jgi:succinate dehydrogenase / fumarate reductase membrane anchor subunit
VRRDNWGTASYLFMRFSGLALIILVITHFVIQHVVNDVHNLSIEFVAERWANIGWRIFDALMLGLGLIHGLNGTRMVVNDYILHPGLNRIVKVLLLLIGAALLFVGTVAVIGGARVTM